MDWSKIKARTKQAKKKREPVRVESKTGTRCECCGTQRRKLKLYIASVPGVSYFRNGTPADGEPITACTEACAREAYGGPRRRPKGLTLRRG